MHCDKLSTVSGTDRPVLPLWWTVIDRATGAGRRVPSRSISACALVDTGTIRFIARVETGPGSWPAWDFHLSRCSTRHALLCRGRTRKASGDDGGWTLSKSHHKLDGRAQPAGRVIFYVRQVVALVGGPCHAMPSHTSPFSPMSTRAPGTSIEAG